MVYIASVEVFTVDGIIIKGGLKLQGEISIQGSKNAVLPIMAASILNSGITVISNCPRISDVWDMIELLKDLGCVIKFEENTLIINSKDIYKTEIDSILAEKIRASVVLLGPLLARFGHAKMSRPGGCNIGSRPINFHLDAFKKMNAICDESDKKVYVESTKLTGANIFLPYPSVGATENIILAAVLADGTTEIHNVATEPEVIELCQFLIRMGAKILGIGSDVLIISGVKKLHDIEYRVRPDRIVMGTYMCACMSTGGKIVLRNCSIADGVGYIDVLCGMGAAIRCENDSIMINSERRIQALNYIKTMPYPGFPTDMQSIVMSVLCKAEGTSVIKETIFNKRLELASQLNKMGASIEVLDNKAIITGVENIKGTTVTAKDLRGGAALVVAGLSAEGVTTVQETIYIKRGYADICSDLKKLGADIEWEKVNQENEKVNLN